MKYTTYTTIRNISFFITIMVTLLILFVEYKYYSTYDVISTIELPKEADFKLDILGGKDNIEEDFRKVREAYWSGEYDGSLTLVKCKNGNHIIEVKDQDLIWIDNHTTEAGNIHYNPEKASSQKALLNTTISSDKEGAWIYNLGSEQIQYWEKGIELRCYPELCKIEYCKRSELPKFKKLGDFIFEGYAPNASVLNIKTGKLTSISDKITNIQCNENSVRYVTTSHESYILKKTDPTNPVRTKVNNNDQNKQQQISKVEKNVYKKVLKAIKKGYEGSFISLEKLTNSKKDKGIYVSYNYTGKGDSKERLIINNRETMFFVD